jgi:hypothetical protein
MNKNNARFSQYGEEPTIAEILSDPIVHLLMRRDRVDEPELTALIETARHSLKRREALPITRAA